MPVDNLLVWRSGFNDLPLVGDDSWIPNFANWVSGRVSGKAQLQGIGGTPPVFTFNTGVFMNYLARMEPTDDVNKAVERLAAAWAAAVKASVFSVSPGAYFNSPSPATLWSIVGGNVGVLEIPSVSGAESQLRSALANAQQTDDGLQSKIPEVLRSAFLKLNYKISGTNSVTPTPGPLIVTAKMV